MHEEIIIAGFGGQGVMLLGQVIAYSAILKGYKATWLPSYGPEMRGGTANCKVVISTDEVGSPLVEKPDTLIALNQPALRKFEKSVKPDGKIIINESIIKDLPEREDIELVKVPGYELVEKFNNKKVFNMLFLGVYMNDKEFYSLENIVEVLEKKLGKNRKEIIDLNVKAIEEGKRFIKN